MYVIVGLEAFAFALSRRCCAVEGLVIYTRELDRWDVFLILWYTVNLLLGMSLTWPRACYICNTI